MIPAYADTSPSPLRQGRSGQEWLFNDPLQTMAGPLDTDPFTAVAHLAHMPVSTRLDPLSVSVLSSPMHDYLWVYYQFYRVSTYFGYIESHHSWPADANIASKSTKSVS